MLPLHAVCRPAPLPSPTSTPVRQMVSDVVGERDPLYTDLKTLAKAGLSIENGKPLGNTFTRDDALCFIRVHVLALANNTPKDWLTLRRQHPLVYHALLRSINRFASTLYSAKATEAAFWSINKAINEDFIPSDFWGYAARNQVFYGGNPPTVLSYDGVYEIPSVWTREEFAEFAVRQWRLLPGNLPQNPKHRARYLDCVRRLLVYFSEDIKAQGYTPETLAQMGQAFPDVPNNHWSAPAVFRAWSSGVLTGYPDATFRGK